MLDYSTSRSDRQERERDTHLGQLLGGEWQSSSGPSLCIVCAIRFFELTKCPLQGVENALLWMFHIGQWVVQTGRRSLLEAHHKHDYSLFRRWLTVELVC
jgi:hypothetical protein